MKLIVGLGNPGRKYQGTRHNVGFLVLDSLESRSASGKRQVEFQAESVGANVGGDKALLLWPQTFMNLSGSSVLAARDFYKLSDADVMVVCDDFNLPLGKLRVRKEGSAGGQKGLENIVQRLGTQQVPRLRIGIGSPPSGRDPADFVLSKFKTDEQTEIEIAIARAADAVEVWAREGIEVCMNRFNAGGTG
jgi:PTH1 family peptidyl-tRNA hydrolase